MARMIRSGKRIAGKNTAGKNTAGKRTVLTALLVAALAVGVLTACGGNTYEKIETVADGRVVSTGETRQDMPESTAKAEPSGGENIASAAQSPESAEPFMPEPSASEPSAAPILLFGGDVFLSGHVLSAYEKAGGIAGVVSGEYRSAIGEADFFMVNEEFPFSSRGSQAQDKQYTFRLPPEKVSMFGELGIDGVTLANNHALDYGEEALLDSCAVLDGAGILHTGAGANLEEAKQPVRVEAGGMRIAVVGATRVMMDSGWAAGKNHAGMLSTYDPAVLLQEIRSLRETEDYVVVFVHWGVEKEERPQEYQRTLAQQYIDAGADLVVGCHPHVLQGIEYYKGKPIVYSLGNFVFGSSIPRTMLLEVTLEGEGISADTAAGKAGREAREARAGSPSARLRLLPGTSGAGYTRMLTDEGKRAEFFQYLEGISFGVRYLEDGTVVGEAAAGTDSAAQP